MRVIALVLSVAALSCIHPGLRGNGFVKEDVRQVPAFEAVDVCCGFEATIEPGPVPEVRVEADDNLLPHIRTEVENGWLEIGTREASWLSPSRTVRVHVVTPRLTQVSASGGAHLFARAGEPGELRSASASGGATVRLSGVAAQALELSASGGAEVYAQGMAHKLEVEASGGALVHAFELAVAKARAEASGGARAELSCSESLEAEASGGGRVHLREHPRHHEVSQSGGGAVVFPEHPGE